MCFLEMYFVIIIIIEPPHEKVHVFVYNVFVDKLANG